MREKCRGCSGGSSSDSGDGGGGSAPTRSSLRAPPSSRERLRPRQAPGRTTPATRPLGRTALTQGRHRHPEPVRRRAGPAAARDSGLGVAAAPRPAPPRPEPGPGRRALRGAGFGARGAGLVLRGLRPRAGWGRGRRAGARSSVLRASRRPVSGAVGGGKKAPAGGEGRGAGWGWGGRREEGAGCGGAPGADRASGWPRDTRSALRHARRGTLRADESPAWPRPTRRPAGLWASQPLRARPPGARPGCGPGPDSGLGRLRAAVPAPPPPPATPGPAAFGGEIKNCRSRGRTAHTMRGREPHSFHEYSSSAWLGSSSASPETFPP